MKVIQSPLFERTVKKLRPREKEALDEQVRQIIGNPKIGEEKKGDLQGVRVHKFRILHQQYLLAYTIGKEQLALLMLGPHENYYRDLKRYLKP